jgi:hypothetical protein
MMNSESTCGKNNKIAADFYDLRYAIGANLSELRAYR